MARFPRFIALENEDAALMEDDVSDEEVSEKESSDVESDEHNSSKKVLGEMKPLSEEAIAEFNNKIKRTGVVGTHRRIDR